jgi:hypothetical protein
MALNLLPLLLGATQGLGEGLQVRNQLQEQARQRTQQDQQNRLGTLLKLIEGQREGAWGTDFSSQIWKQAGYEPMKQTIQVPRQEYVGQVEASRKDPGMVGPMPAVKGYTTVYDPKEVSIFETIKPPAPKPVEVAGNLVNPLTGQVVYQAPPKPAPAPKPQMGWIPQSDGRKVWGELTPGMVAAPTPKAAPDPSITEEREARRQEREDRKREKMERNFRDQAEKLVPKVVPSSLDLPGDYEQRFADRNAAVEAVYRGLLHQVQTKGQKPKKQTSPAQPKKTSLVETLKAGGLL